MEDIIYITLEQAIETHRLTIEKSGGGTLGYRDVEQLGSVLAHIQNDDYYPEFIDKLTHLFWGSCKFHCFIDGNKRIALSLCTQFLLLNGYVFLASEFMKLMENISYHVAAGKISKELLREIIASMFNYDIENESIKLKILNAIS
ncbi:MAG: type II toxin-antitoxin system death-on-curing family toxin [Peptococcia bacterium]|jgi:death-on-curing protein